MDEQLISFKTAKLAKEKDITQFDCVVEGYEPDTGESTLIVRSDRNDIIVAPTQSLLQKYIREERDVNICVYRNAVGWLWSLDKADGGTNLGWSGFTGNCRGVWKTFEDALEDALYKCLLKTTREYRRETNGAHWRGYADYLIELCK